MDAVAVSAVPDVLAPGLQVAFCGINPGRWSAAAGAHSANPRTDFWRLLHDAGFTPRLYAPEEQHELPALGLGLTNAAYRTDLAKKAVANLRKQGLDVTGKSFKKKAVVLKEGGK